ncbi:MAG: WG repeat-containing protein [Muribaculaceae bacterium]|nr:WG repeat-containing protein [Muribaculaceae bacterium]
MKIINFVFAVLCFIVPLRLQSQDVNKLIDDCKMYFQYGEFEAALKNLNVLISNGFTEVEIDGVPIKDLVVVCSDTINHFYYEKALKSFRLRDFEKAIDWIEQCPVDSSKQLEQLKHKSLALKDELKKHHPMCITKELVKVFKNKVMKYGCDANIMAYIKGEWATDGVGNYFDIKGNEHKTKYRTSDPFSEGLARVTDYGKYGFINENFELVIPCEFVLAYDFSDGAAYVVRNVGGGPYRRYFIDKDGSPLFDYRRIDKLKKNGIDYYEPYYKDGYLLCYDIYNIHVTGLLDKTGKFLPLPEKVESFYFVRQMNEGLAPFCGYSAYGKKWGFVDGMGKVIIKPIFEDVELPFSEGLAVVRKENNKRCYINKNGEVVLEQFEGARMLEPFENGTAHIITEDGKDVIIDKQGQIVYENTAPKLQTIRSSIYNNMFVITRNGEIGLGDIFGFTTFDDMFN